MTASQMSLFTSQDAKYIHLFFSTELVAYLHRSSRGSRSFFDIHSGHATAAYSLRAEAARQRTPALHWVNATVALHLSPSAPDWHSLNLFFLSKLVVVASPVSVLGSKRHGNPEAWFSPWLHAHPTRPSSLSWSTPLAHLLSLTARRWAQLAAFSF